MTSGNEYARPHARAHTHNKSLKVVVTTKAVENRIAGGRPVLVKAEMGTINSYRQ